MLLREVVLDAHLVDGVQLRFQPVDMVLFVGQDFLYQFARTVVARFSAGLMPSFRRLTACTRVSGRFRTALHVWPNVDLEVVAHVGSAVEIEDALHHFSACIISSIDSF